MTIKKMLCMPLVFLWSFASYSIHPSIAFFDLNIRKNPVTFNEISFEQRIEHCIKKLYDQLKQLPHAHELTQLLNEISNFKGKDAYDFLDWLRKIRPIIIVAKQQAATNVKEIDLLIYTKIIDGLIGYVKNAHLMVLELLDKSISYWEYQKAHSWYHFFHKSPRRWVESSQIQTVKDHLESLRKHEHTYRKQLGKLMRSCDSFDKDYSLGELEQWLSTMTQFLYKVASGKKIEKISADQFESSFKETISKLGGFHERIIQRFAHDKQPSYIERNWFDYSVGTLGASVIGLWLFRYRGKLAEWGNSIIHRAWAMLHTPYKEFKELFFDPTTKERDEKLKKWYKDLAIRIRNKKNLKSLTDEKIDEWVKNFDHTALENLLLDDLPTMCSQIRTNFESLKNRHTENNYPWYHYHRYSGWSEYAHELGMLIPDSIDKVSESFEAGLLYSALYKRRLEETERINFALSSAFPALFTLWGGTVVARKIYALINRKTDYKPLRNTLIELYHLLNVYNANDLGMLLAADYGKLIYLVEKLKKLIVLVPDEDRLAFADDMHKLESRCLDAQKKM